MRVKRREEAEGRNRRKGKGERDGKRWRGRKRKALGQVKTADILVL